MIRLLVMMMLLLAWNARAAIKVLVTVVEQKSGRPVQNLKAEDFAIFEDKLVRRVEAAEFAAKPIDVMMVVDTSLVGGMVQSIASSLIGELKEKEQMALVSYDSSAELLQDFTSSRQALGAALSRVKLGNSPRVLDGLFAAMEGGFQHATFRRVILLVTSGVESGGRVHEREVIRFARKNGVSIFPVVATGASRGLFETLARQTGGASFNLRDLQRSGEKSPPGLIFSAMRSHYTLTITGNLGLGEKLRVEIKRPEKVQASILALD
ncbi:MAG: VWA domain-containing protein [Acidobacteria bacterium]|nr:VWA domain-containing protein [Acidobacteriota bacterium]